MATLGARRFTIDQNLELPVDQFDAEAENSSVFVNASEADRMTLKAGYRTAAGVAYDIGQMESAVIDEYEITVTPSDLTTRIRGRDPCARLLDRTIRKRFQRLPVREAVETVKTSAAADAVMTIQGRFHASDIARDLVEGVGLVLAWEARDYELLEDFEFSGRIVDAIGELVAPFNHVPPFRVDVYVQGLTVMVRQRQLAPTAEHTYSVHDARIRQLTIRKRPVLKFGLVSLEGRVDSTSHKRAQDFTGGGGGGFTGLTGEDADLGPAGKGVVKGSEVEESDQADTFDSDEQVLTRTTERTTYRMPDRIAVKRIRETLARRKAVADAAWTAAFVVALQQGRTEDQAAAVAGVAYTAALALQLLSRETTIYGWEDSVYDETGPINSPLPVSEYTTVEELRKNEQPGSAIIAPQALQTTRTIYTTYGYDRRRFLKEHVTVKRELGEKGKDLYNNITGSLIPGKPAELEDREIVVKSLRDKAPAIVEQRTTTYRRVKNPKTQDFDWKLTGFDVQVQGGYRPGGPGRRRPPREASTTQPIVILAGAGQGADLGTAAGELIHVRLEQTISTDVDARMVRVANEHLSEADLAFVMAQFVAAHGKREVELLFEAASMPWLRKGTVIQFTGLTQEDGVTAIALQPALVVNNVLEYDETGDQPSMRSRVQAIYWA